MPATDDEANADMATETYQQMIIGFFAGLGLLLLGIVNAFLRAKPLPLRLAVSVFMIVLIVLSAYALSSTDSSVESVAVILLVVYVATLIVGSEWLATACSATIRLLRQPAACWTLVAVLGCGAALGSVLRAELQFDEHVNQQMLDLAFVTTKPDTTSAPVRLVTDLGREVATQEATAPRDEPALSRLESQILANPAISVGVIRSEAASDRSNCHGWIFTGGRYWISGTEVDHILTENRYFAVSDPRPGDLAIYRGGPEVLHTAIVRYVTPGQPVLVQGKWGCTGVFLHAADKSLYGSNVTYYRSPRPGHLLAGLTTVEPITAGAASPCIEPNPSNPDEFTE